MLVYQRVILISRATLDLAAGIRLCRAIPKTWPFPQIGIAPAGDLNSNDAAIPTRSSNRITKHLRQRYDGRTVRHRNCRKTTSLSGADFKGSKSEWNWGNWVLFSSLLFDFSQTRLSAFRNSDIFLEKFFRSLTIITSIVVMTRTTI